MSENNAMAKILIVDDSTTDIQILHEAFMEDCEVFAATSGEEALERVALNPPDLILLDVIMPGMSGHDVCLKLKADKTTADIPVIFITAKGDEHNETEAFALGATDYITKPYNLVVVRSRINAVLRLKREMDMRQSLARELKHLNERLEDKVEEQVSQLRNAHEKVRASEELLSVVLENIIDPVFITDDKGRFTYICSNVPVILGYSKNELMDKGDVQAIMGNDPFSIKDLDDSGEIRNIESLLIDKQGVKRVYLITVKRVSIQDGTILWICRDIDDRKKLEKRLQQAYKMEAIGTLAGGIAHDFNNILSAIVGYTEIAKDSVEKNSAQYSYLSHVLDAGERAKDLVKQILTFSRENEGERKPFKIALPVREAFRLLRASLPPAIDMQSSIRSDRTVLADPSQIHQVVMNLCTNAFQAMPTTGGTLNVKLEDEVVTAAPVSEHVDLIPGTYVKLTVADTGHGIPENIVNRIFDPFFTTKEKGEGTGLGLAVVHGIVKSHGGSITVASRPQTGTVFEIWLPAIKQAALLEHTADGTIPTGTETILIIDDEDMIVDICKNMLESLGYQVIGQTSSADGLEAFRQSPDKFDLVITDMWMPLMSGLDLARAVLEIKPQVRVMMCTGFSAEIDEQQVQSAGIRGIIRKPILKRDIAEAIRSVLDHEKTMSE